MAARDARSAGTRPLSQARSSTSSRTTFDPNSSTRELARRKAAAHEAEAASYWHVAPASFLILGFVGAGLPPGASNAWYWIGALALNVIARLAMVSEPAAQTVQAEAAQRRARHWRAASHLADAALWGGLVLAIDPMPVAMATRVGGALAGAMLVSSLSSTGRSMPLGLALSWAVPILLMGIHAASGNLIGVGLMLWMASVVWLGATRPAPVVYAQRPDTTKSRAAGSVRGGVQLAIQTAGNPMIAVQGGRIFEINTPAAALLGLLAHDCVGRPVAELIVLDPADALERALALRGSAPLVASARLAAAASGAPIGVRLKVGRTHGAEPVTVIALEAPARMGPPTLAPAPVSATVAPPVRELAAITAPVAGPGLLEKLPVLAWVVDPEGRIVHTHSLDVRRWGMKIGPAMRPRWWDAFAYQPRSREDFLKALSTALAGRPTYDVLIERASASGGLLALRSHCMPIQWPDLQGNDRPAVLVLDTIASAQELAANDQVRRRKDHYKSLVEASPNLIWACDERFRFTFVSRRASRDLYGYAVEDLIGVSIGVLLNPAAEQTAARHSLVALRDGHVMRDVEMSHVTKDGRGIIVAVSAVALAGIGNRFSGAVGMMVDLTTLKQREASLAEALRIERTVLDAAGQALAVVRDGMVARCNDAFLQLLQRSAGELQTLPIMAVFSEDSEWVSAMGAADRAALSDQAVVREIKLMRSPTGLPDDQTVWCQLTLRMIEKGEYVVALTDIDSIRRREAHALFDARHDELTGLANRRLFAERARSALATSALRNSGCAIVVIDLDRFKQINDRYGHHAGDEVLQEMARRLQRVVRPQDTVARYGGDEFALLIPDAGSRRDIETITQRIIDELARPVHFNGRHEEALSASVGVALASEQGREPSWLLSLADRAMYDAKISGGNRAVFAPVSDASLDFGTAPAIASGPGLVSVPSVGRAA